MQNEKRQQRMQSHDGKQHNSDGSESKIFDPIQLRSAIYGLGLENFP